MQKRCSLEVGLTIGNYSPENLTPSSGETRTCSEEGTRSHWTYSKLLQECNLLQMPKEREFTWSLAEMRMFNIWMKVTPRKAKTEYELSWLAAVVFLIRRWKKPVHTRSPHPPQAQLLIYFQRLIFTIITYLSNYLFTSIQ